MIEKKPADQQSKNGSKNKSNLKKIIQNKQAFRQAIKVSLLIQNPYLPKESK